MLIYNNCILITHLEGIAVPNNTCYIKKCKINYEWDDTDIYKPVSGFGPT